MKRQKQTSFFIDRSTDRLFKLLGAKLGFKNRGQTASAALHFLNSLQNHTNYPPEIKKSLNGLFANAAEKVTKNSDEYIWDETIELFPDVEEEV